jgi:hypothetical protein
MADLTIVPLGDGHFRVEVVEGASSTAHDVVVPPDTIARLGWSGTPEELLRGSFEFLLRRERKESILPSFTIDVIGRYFPEWEAAARRGF